MFCFFLTGHKLPSCGAGAIQRFAAFIPFDFLSILSSDSREFKLIIELFKRKIKHL